MGVRRQILGEGYLVGTGGVRGQIWEWGSPEF